MAEDCHDLNGGTLGSAPQQDGQTRTSISLTLTHTHFNDVHKTFTQSGSVSSTSNHTQASSLLHNRRKGTNIHM